MITKYTTAALPLMTSAMSAYPFSEDLKARYTFKTTYDEEVCGAIRSGDTLWVPRESVPYAPPEQDFRTSFPRSAIDCTWQPRHEQGTLCEQSIKLLEQGRSHLFQAPTGHGKCQIKGETVLMYSGEQKKVEDIVVGDILMGPDSLPRWVLSLGTGVMEAYEIVTSHGEVIRCNEDHLLSLVRTNSFQKNGNGVGGRFRGGEKLDIPVKEYLKKSRNFKHLMKLWKPESVVFPQGYALTIDPYVLGLLLGDGGLIYGVQFTSKDQILVEALRKEAIKYGCSLTKDRSDPYGWHVICGKRDGKGHPYNSFKDELADMGLIGKGSGNKYVPRDYKTAAIADRLQLIAGLLDTDGHHVGNVFDWVSKSERLADDLCYLCWSVGLAAFKSKCHKKCVNNGVWGVYYRVCISGNTNKIPCRLLRKQASARKQKKNALVHGFKISSIGEQEYFGFTLDGDHRYLTGNFFVTHNTVEASYIACRIGQPTLIVVTKDDLVQQWKEALIEVLHIPASHIGHIQADVCDWVGKRFVIGMVQSLIIPERYDPEMYKAFGLMILDECHQLAADCFVRVCQTFPAKLRLGLSATPDRKDGKTKLLHWHVGHTLVVGTIVPMKPRVLIKQTGWKIPVVRRLIEHSWQYVPIPHEPGRMVLVYKAMAASTPRNLEIVNFTLQAYQKGRNTLILSELREAHLNRLFQMLAGEGIPGNEMGYYVGQMSKTELAMSKKARIILGTYKMCSTGTDCPAWDTLVLATPRADVKQPIGRVLRSMSGKKQPVILDLVDSDSLLQGFALSRLKNYYGVNAEVVKV